MKNGNDKLSKLDNDTITAAVKKAITKLKATNSQTENVGQNAGITKTGVKAQNTVNPLKLVSVERRLNSADKAYIPEIERPKIVSNTSGRAPKLSEIQQYEEYYRQEQQQTKAVEKAKSLDAFERTLRHDLYGEPIAKKPVPLDNGVYTLDNSGSAPLRPGGPLVNNGARTRGYTDTASDTGAPIRFTGGSLKDIERKHNEAMARKDETLHDFHTSLANHSVDLSNLTPEQEDVLDLVEKELIKKSVLGTLTQEDKKRVFENTLEYLDSHAKSPNGDPYTVVIKVISDDYTTKMIPELGSIQTEGLTESDIDAIFDYGRQYSQDADQNEVYAQQRAYKKEVFMDEVERYNSDLRSGAVKEGEFQEYYDRAMMKIYETCVMPIPVKDKKGKVVGSVTIGDLISPYDDSFGATIALNALEKLGTSYDEMDCEQLVKWAVAQENPDWGKYGIGSNAYYQSTRTKNEWIAKSDTDRVPLDRLHTGDLLYWRNTQGEIVHTAIYLGNGYMIESAGTVKVTPFRERTNYGEGELDCQQ